MFKINEYVTVTLPGGEKVKGVVRALPPEDTGSYQVYVYKMKRHIQVPESQIRENDD